MSKQQWLVNNRDEQMTCKSWQMASKQHTNNISWQQILIWHQFGAGLSLQVAAWLMGIIFDVTVLLSFWSHLGFWSIITTINFLFVAASQWQSPASTKWKLSVLPIHVWQKWYQLRLLRRLGRGFGHGFGHLIDCSMIIAGIQHLWVHIGRKCEGTNREIHSKN